MSIKASEVLGEALQELDAGWVQHAFRSQGNVCAVGAIERVTMRHLQEDPIPAAAKAKKALLEKIREMTSNMFGSIPGFNDNSNTTKADVLLAMEKATIGLLEIG